jgi:transcriptional regulator with XRE-family HTH domain
MAKGKYQRWLTSNGLVQLEAWAAHGLTDEQIAHNIGISTSTYYKWENDFSEFSEAIQKGKEVADYKVENALYQRALGYDHDEVTHETIDDGNTVTTKDKRVTKHIPPDVGAAAFWLKNRQRDRWKDRNSEYQEQKLDIDRQRLELDKQKEDDKW